MLESSKINNYCYLVSVQPPKDDRDQYITRKHDTGLNAMMGIGYSGIVYYCDSANPGSTSDSTNLMMSSVPKQMEEWLAQGLPFPEAMIGGDSIFQSHLPWLCTPYSVAEAAADPLKRNFNKKFCGARDAVERYMLFTDIVFIISQV